MLKCPQQSTASAAAQTPRSLLELQAAEARRLGLVFSYKAETLLGSKTKGFKGRAATCPTAGNYHVSKQRLCLDRGGREESFAAAVTISLWMLACRTTICRLQCFINASHYSSVYQNVIYILASFIKRKNL